VAEQAWEQPPLTEERFGVDGALLEAWTARESFLTSGVLGKAESLRGQLAANSRESLNFLKQGRQAGLSRVAVWPVPQM
jgi:hypothetical protein